MKLAVVRILVRPAFELTGPVEIHHIEVRPSQLCQPLNDWHVELFHRLRCGSSANTTRASGFTDLMGVMGILNQQREVLRRICPCVHWLIFDLEEPDLRKALDGCSNVGPVRFPVGRQPNELRLRWDRRDS